MCTRARQGIRGPADSRRAQPASHGAHETEGLRLRPPRKLLRLKLSLRRHSRNHLGMEETCCLRPASSSATGSSGSSPSLPPASCTFPTARPLLLRLVLYTLELIMSLETRLNTSLPHLTSHLVNLLLEGGGRRGLGLAGLQRFDFGFSERGVQDLCARVMRKRALVSIHVARHPRPASSHPSLHPCLYACSLCTRMQSVYTTAPGLTHAQTRSPARTPSQRNPAHTNMCVHPLAQQHVIS